MFRQSGRVSQQNPRISRSESSHESLEHDLRVLLQYRNKNFAVRSCSPSAGSICLSRLAVGMINTTGEGRCDPTQDVAACCLSNNYVC
jgi:hypothetical protein